MAVFPMTFLIAKLAAYVFDNTDLVLITVYLANRLQRVMLGPILFNLFINDLTFFIKETEVRNFADDTTMYSCSLNHEEAHRKLSNATLIVLNWFRINSMVASPVKLNVSRIINK